MKFAKERVVGTGDGLGSFGLDGGMRQIDEELVPVFSTELKKELLDLGKKSDNEDSDEAMGEDIEQEAISKAIEKIEEIKE